MHKVKHRQEEIEHKKGVGTEANPHAKDGTKLSELKYQEDPSKPQGSKKPTRRTQTRLGVCGGLALLDTLYRFDHKEATGDEDEGIDKANGLVDDQLRGVEEGYIKSP